MKNHVSLIWLETVLTFEYVFRNKNDYQKLQLSFCTEDDIWLEILADLFLEHSVGLSRLNDEQIAFVVNELGRQGITRLITWGEKISVEAQVNALMAIQNLVLEFLVPRCSNEYTGIGASSLDDACVRFWNAMPLPSSKLLANRTYRDALRSTLLQPMQIDCGIYYLATSDFVNLIMAVNGQGEFEEELSAELENWAKKRT
jgi:hypothetical protein